MKIKKKELKLLREREERRASRKPEVIQHKPGDNKDAANLKSEFLLLQKKYSRFEIKEKELQKLCADWKSENYADFYKSVCKIINSPGSKFKARAGVITAVLISYFSCFKSFK